MEEETIISKFYARLKKSDILETLRHSKNYLGGNMAIKALSVMSIPIFTRLLTREEYGILSVFITSVGILTVLLSMNLFSAIGRYYYERTEDFGKFLGSNIIFLIPILIINVIIAFLLKRYISIWLKIPIGVVTPLLVLVFITVIYSIFNQIMQAKKQSGLLAIANSLWAYLGFFMGVGLIFLFTKERYLGIIWGRIIAGIIFSVYCIYMIRRDFKLIFNFEYVRYTFKFAIPLLPYALSGVILSQFDRIMINKMVGSAEAGLYSLAYNIGMVLGIVITSVDSAVIPDFFKLLNRGQGQRLDRLIQGVFSFVIMCAFLLIAFSREIVTALANRRFWPAIPVVPWVVLGYVFFAMFTIYGRYIGYSKKTVYASIISITCGVVNIVLNAVFIPRYGYIAGAYTTVVSYFLMFAMTWSIVKFILRMEITPLWLIWRPTLIMFCFIAFVLFLNILNLSFTMLFIMKLMILVLFGIIIFHRMIKAVLNLR